ncbi:hypothetical protein BD1_45 [Octadecabacter Antarctic BD virus 1]|nr:hypothetical protein BD1_45 [Octadecabacter Antarctic BD virus 1]
MYHEKTHEAAKKARKQGQGKASTDEPTQIEVAYRSIRTIGDAVDKMTDALAMASTEAGAVGEHCVQLRDATTPAAGCILHLGAASEYAKKVNAELAGAADLVRQAAIHDASHKNREARLLTEVGELSKGWARTSRDARTLADMLNHEGRRRVNSVRLNFFQSAVILGMVIMVLTA